MFFRQRSSRMRFSPVGADAIHGVIALPSGPFAEAVVAVVLVASSDWPRALQRHALRHVRSDEAILVVEGATAEVRVAVRTGRFV